MTRACLIATRFAVPVLLAGLLLASPAHAQSSASYKLSEQVLNAGGHPSAGSALNSSSFRIKLDSIGEGVVQTGMGSASFHVDAAFVSVYPPPLEVLGLSWVDKTTLSWNLEKSVGEYELYRNLINTLPGTFGSCFASHLTSRTATEPSNPPLGQGWFYLATARNRLNEEGTKGKSSNGSTRPNTTPCP